MRCIRSREKKKEKWKERKGKKLFKFSGLRLHISFLESLNTLVYVILYSVFSAVKKLLVLHQFRP